MKDKKKDILEGLLNNRIKKIDELKAEKKESVLGFVKGVYGDKKRKGLDKPEIMHTADVIDNSYLDKVDDIKRSTKLYKAGLLQDTMDVSGISPEDLKKRLGLNDDLMGTLKRLSKTIPNKDGTEYLDGILKDEDALIIKLASRISNIRDLINWIQNDNGLSKQSKKIADRFLKETPELQAGIKKIYPTLLKDKPDSPIASQVIDLKKCLSDLTKVYDLYKNQPIAERMFQDKDVSKSYDISPEDIAKTYEIVTRLWKTSEELQKAYPDYLQRLKKAMTNLESKIKAKGFEYVKNLFTKVAFDEDNFMKLYEEYLHERLISGVEKLSTRKESLPKEGLVAAISKSTGVSLSEIYTKAESTNKDDIKWIYDNLTAFMDKAFDKIKDELAAFATKEDGDFIFRPTKYKNFERAYEKYMIDVKDDPKVNDFLDLGDIMGFRGRFDNLDGVINFVINTIENTDYYVFKLKSYVGSGTPYQGVNMNMNYDGEVNFECQSVMDQVQIATDLNHDIFYKKMMKVNSGEKKAVAMMVQIFLGYMFDELFKFKK
jgi:uncharacterized protein (UPF0335 family)